MAAPLLAPLPAGATTNAQCVWPNHQWGDGSLYRWHNPGVHMNFGAVFAAWAATNPTVPPGHPFAGQQILNCPPLSDPNAGLPVAQHWPVLPPLPGQAFGCIDLLALIPLHTTLNTVGTAGNLARFIACGGATNGAYEAPRTSQTRLSLSLSLSLSLTQIQARRPTGSLGGGCTRCCQLGSG